MMGLRYRAGICAIALLAGSATLQFEPAVLRDLVVENGSHRIVVGAVKTPLWNAAFAQSADSFSLDNVSFISGSTTYEAKRIEFSGVSSSRADIEALFASTSPESMESRLKRITVKRIAIPEARMRQTVGKQTQTTTYRNVSLNDVSQGYIASAVVEAAAVETNNGKDDVVVSTGRGIMNDLDLPALANLYEVKADSAAAPMRRIYGAFSVDNLELADNKAGATFKVARFSGRDFLARSTKDSWTGTAGIFTEMADRTDLSTDDQARLFSAMADFLDAFQIGFVEASGIEATAKSKGSKGSPGLARIKRIAYTGGTDTQPPDVRWEGFEFSHEDNRVKIDGMSLTGFSFRQTLDGLKMIQGKSFDEIDHATIRALIPTLGTLRVSGVDIDALSKEGVTSERVKMTIKDFAVTADKPVNGIPTNIRIEQRNAIFPLPADSTDDFTKQLAALGYKTIDTSYVVSATWNEALSEIELKEVAIQTPDMGSFLLTGTIGNVTKDLFSADQATAAAALIGAKAKSAQVTVEEKGLLSRYMANAAKEQKTKPETLRQMYAGAAPFVISSMLGNSEQAKTLGQAVAQFIAKPGKLTINAQPKNPSGFGVMDAMLASDPKTALEKLTISAKAE